MQANDSDTGIRIKRRAGMFVVALLMLVMLGLGYFYSAGRKSEGNVVLVAVRGYLSVEQKTTLQEQFDGYAPEDMENLQLRIYEFPAAGADDSGVNTSKMFGEMMAEIKTGDASLILLDRNIYELLGDETLFEDLSVRYPSDPAVTGKYLYAVKGKPFLNAQGMEGFPETFLCLRNSRSSTVNRSAVTLDLYERQCSLLDNIVYSTPPSGYSAQGLEK